MNSRLAQYQEASEVFVEREMLDENVIGIIVSGSTVHGRPDQNSDVDIHVILSPDCDYRERRNTWIDGIEIESFKNPPAQIRAYFEREKARPHTAHMLAYGNIAYSNSPIVEELVATARALIEQVPPALQADQLEFEKYFIDDYFKDFEDALHNKDRLGASLIRHKIVNRCIDIFCKAHRVRRGKDKRLAEQLSGIDADFAEGIQTAMREAWNQVSAITALRVATEKLLGGRRSLEWTMRSGLDLLEGH